jgi:thioredoxin 1
LLILIIQSTANQIFHFGIRQLPINCLKAYHISTKMSNYAKYKSLGDQPEARMQENRAWAAEGGQAQQQPTIPPQQYHPTSDSGSCKSIKTHAQKQAAIAQNRVVVIDIYTDWCGPCKACAPKFEELALQYGDRCTFLKEDAELELSAGVTAVPAFDFYVGGQQVGRIVSADMDQVKEKLLSLISN